MDDVRIGQLVALYKSKALDFEVFATGVRKWFQGNLVLAELGAVHSVKYRLKDPDHLAEKLKRKFFDQDIGDDEFFTRVTDLAGVRVLHLHQAQFENIHNQIMGKVAQNDWVLAEDPKAFTWDPESDRFFQGLGVSVEVRETFYTSVHYLLKPRMDSPVCCEVQVRTLFEEIWGEVDHQLNYPEKTKIVACSEQLRVLAKVVGAGSRLVDSIYRSIGAEERA